MRRAVHDRQQAGQFILAGSASPADDVTRNCGAGRFSVMRMRPMSLVESGHSTATVSLRGLLEGQTQNARDAGLTVPALANLIAIGGWPAWQGKSLQSVSRAARDHLTQISHVDVSAIQGQRRNPKKVDALLRSLARNVATEATITTIAGDTAGAEETMDRETASAYLAVLERLMVVENQPAWAPAMRSRVQLRSSPKRHFVDPSLAVAALRISPTKLLADLEGLGLLFESLVVRDLRVLSQPLDGPSAALPGQQMTNTTSGTRSQAPFPAVSTGRTEPQRPGRTTVSSASPVQNYHRPPTGEHRRSAHRRTARSPRPPHPLARRSSAWCFRQQPQPPSPDNLWPVLADRIADGQAVMIEPADNEQGWSFRTAGRHRWHPVDLDGLILVGRPRR